ncbi:uncharacterized protein [Palaemon carinicauda]|uniref:uncharacterized protein n=1 Tax=Palaemon carinicauda TaxID=392227 RepID=UPI0035B5FE07
MFSIFDKSRTIDIIYLDFQKAFDKVSHKKLMVKITALGIIDEPSEWNENWLTNRNQRVVIDGEASEWAPVTSGVPQGSVLGPLLILTYISNIDLGLTSRIAKFFDGTKLGINAAKSEDGNEIESVDQEEDLGIIINKDLKFTKQSMKVEKKAQKLTNDIKRQFKYRNKGIVLQLNTSLGNEIESVDQEEDLKFTKKSMKVEKKAQKLTNYIKRQFKYRNKGIVLQLYTSLLESVDGWCVYHMHEIGFGLDAIYCHEVHFPSNANF